MISKEYFVEILDKLKTAEDFVNETNDRAKKLGRKLDSDFFNAYSIGIFHDGIVVNLLDNMFDTDMVSYFVFELGYGDRYEEGCVQEADGTNIDISTAEKLYDYLIKSLESEE